MHDPSTVAFDIKYPWKSRPSKHWPNGYRSTFITIWHEDPETDGTDDSCGWFKRARHGDKAVLEAIRKDFEFNWDPDYGGWFKKDGSPALSVIAITIDMFWSAANAHFRSDGRTNWRRSRKFLNRHLLDIIHFAENPTDSMHPAIVGRYGIAPRADRIASAASVVYGCILRWTRPWYRHPRWHVWHWRLQVHPWQKIRRRLFDRCAECGGHFGWNESPIGTWGGDRIWHSRCDRAGMTPAGPDGEGGS